MSPKIVSPILNLPQDARVSDLINAESHSWKVYLVKQEFIPQEASLILGIPLSYQVVPDKQVWLPTPQGTFLTCSAYKILAISNCKLLPACSNPDRVHFMWNSIWDLQVPHKVKHMIWRASHNSLPTVCNLWRQNVVGLVLCASCKSECEDFVHALWGCASLILIWETNEVVTKLHRYKFVVFANLWEMLMRMRDRLDINLMAMIFWLIWARRNSARVGEVSIEVNQIRKKAEDFLHDFQKANGSKVHRQLLPTSVVRWTPPNFPLYKVNFDGATFSKIGAASLGAVVQDHSGNIWCHD